MRGKRPHGLPWHDDSSVTPSSKVALSCGNPMLFSVPKRTAGIPILNANCIGCSFPMPRQMIDQYTDNYHEGTMRGTAHNKGTNVRRGRFRQLKKAITAWRVCLSPTADM